MTLHRIVVTTVLLSVPALSAAQEAARLEARQSLLGGQQATVYASPTCGCCEGYVAFLRKHGASVEVVRDDAALAAAKTQYGVPLAAQSCHTVLLGGYVVEGHVPLAALRKLLTERPDLTGVAMPGMPTGTPGMEGPRFGPLGVVGFDEAGVTPFVTL